MEGQALAMESCRDLGAALDAHGMSSVAALRLRAGLTQLQLAAMMQIKQPHLSRMENGRVQMPDTDTLLKFAAALDVNLDDVVRAFKADTAKA